MSEITPVNIGGVMVGDGYPTVFMAETSTFFNQDVDLAQSYIQAVVDAGARIFKSEVLHDREVCLRGTGLVHEFQHATGVSTEDYRDLIDRKVMSLDAYREVYGLCTRLSIPFVCSVYDVEGVDFLMEIGAAGIKISRDQMNNHPLVAYAARTGLPLIFDAGKVYFDEVARAVRLARDEGAGGVIVNHHPGANPAPPDVHNMRVMQTYTEVLQVPVGLSCHYRGEEILYLAVGMGANILEKGVVDDPDRIEQDLVSATVLSELKDVVRKVNNCWQAIGQAPARPQEPRDVSRSKCLAAKRRIQEGDVFGIDNLRFSWPPVGIPVEYWDLVAGSRAARTIDANHALQWSDVRIEQAGSPGFKIGVTRS